MRDGVDEEETFEAIRIGDGYFCEIFGVLFGVGDATFFGLKIKD